jgi:hypothetical protein
MKTLLILSLLPFVDIVPVLLMLFLNVNPSLLHDHLHRPDPLHLLLPVAIGNIPRLVMPHGVAELVWVSLRESLEPAFACVEALARVQQFLQLRGLIDQVLLL